MSFETLNIGEGIYTISDLAEILKIKKSRARYWFNAYVRNTLPSITSHRYNFNLDEGLFVNFKSLLQFYVFEELHKMGFKKKSIISAFKTISKTYNTNYPFATNKILTAGDSIYVHLDKENIINANKTRQYNLVQVLAPYLKKIQFDSNGNAIKFYPMGEENSVVVDPTIQFGSPTIKGTRIDVKTILDSFNSGDPKSLISKIYEITEKQVDDALNFASAA